MTEIYILILPVSIVASFLIGRFFGKLILGAKSKKYEIKSEIDPEPQIIPPKKESKKERVYELRINKYFKFKVYLDEISCCDCWNGYGRPDKYIDMRVEGKIWELNDEETEWTSTSASWVRDCCGRCALGGTALKGKHLYRCIKFLRKFEALKLKESQEKEREKKKRLNRINEGLK